jgi:hypothetical protein
LVCQALQEKTVFFTAPYVFSTTKIPGITCAKQLQAAGSLRRRFTLEQFSVSLREQAVSDNGRMFLFDSKGRLIVHPGENTIRAGTNETLAFLQGEESSDPLVRAIVAGYAANPEGMRNLTREIVVDGPPIWCAPRPSGMISKSTRCSPPWLPCPISRDISCACSGASFSSLSGAAGGPAPWPLPVAQDFQVTWSSLNWNRRRFSNPTFPKPSISTRTSRRFTPS